jgi:hypothetical protein
MSDGSHIVTVSINGSTNPADTTSIQFDKTLVNPDQGLTFNILNTISGQNLFLTAIAEVTGGDAALHYTITGTSSVTGPNISITPRIYKVTPTGDVLMFTGEPKTCTSGTTCTVTGDFVPAVWDVSNITSPFFANATVSFTSSPSYKLFSAIAGENGPDQVDTQPLSRTGLTAPEVVVTGELSPPEQGKIADGTSMNNVIPIGGTIEHTLKDGMPITTVSNAKGNPRFWANDTLAVDIAVPNGAGYLPGTMVHEIPSGAIVDHIDTNKQIVMNDGTILYSEINNLPTNVVQIPPEKSPLRGGDCGYPGGYIIRADNWNIAQLDKFTAFWKVPSSPTLTGSSVAHTMFFFNGIEPNPVTTILQPVLEWDNTDTGKYWTLASWDCAVGGPCPHSVRQTVSVGDTIKGEMSYMPKEKHWLISASKNSGTPTEYESVNMTTNKSLVVFSGAFEGYCIPNMDAVPGTVEFYDMSYQYLNGSSVTLSLNPWKNSNLPAELAPKFTTNILSNPSKVQLKIDK